MHDAAEIADRFALGRAHQLTGPHAQGFQGEVWRLDTDRGAWAVKLAFGQVDETDVAAGAAFQEAAHAAGVATPRLVRCRDGHVLADVGLGRVRVDEWVDLANADPHLDAADVGATVAAIHRVTEVPGDDLDPWYHEGVGADRWIELFDQLSLADAPFVGALARQRDELVAMEALIEPATVLQTCHRDLWADNVRRGGDGRVWVIDWHDCGRADPSHELAALLFEYAYDDADRARTMHESYLVAGGPGRVERQPQFSMAIAQLGHILEISCRRWLAAGSPEERSLNEGRVAGFIDKPLSRALIDHIVQAIDPHAGTEA